MRFSLRDFEGMFGCDASDFHPLIIPAINGTNWEYEILEGRDREAVILDILRQVDSGKLTVTGDKSKWERGWGENRDAFKLTRDAAALKPKYLKPNRPLRFLGEFIMPTDQNFEANWYALFSRQFFHRHLQPFDAIYEFGCGSGHNLVALAEMYPDKKIVGLDWAQASVDIAEMLSKDCPNVSGRLFDFFSPDESLKIPPNTAVLTMGALEQTGSRWRYFLSYLLDARPAMVLHAEPFVEMYDWESLFDYSAIKFHTARDYLHGFLDEITSTAGGRIVVKAILRTGFGSYVHEGYSQLIWEPK